MTFLRGRHGYLLTQVNVEESKQKILVSKLYNP